MIARGMTVTVNPGPNLAPWVGTVMAGPKPSREKRVGIVMWWDVRDEDGIYWACPEPHLAP